jgi:hypothetical protein
LNLITEHDFYVAGTIARSKRKLAADNPYPEGSKERQLWFNGWEEGLPYGAYPCPKAFVHVKIGQEFRYGKTVWVKIHEKVGVLPDDLDQWGDTTAMTFPPAMVVYTA